MTVWIRTWKYLSQFSGQSTFRRFTVKYHRYLYGLCIFCFFL